MQGNVAFYGISLPYFQGWPCCPPMLLPVAVMGITSSPSTSSPLCQRENLRGPLPSECHRERLDETCYDWCAKRLGYPLTQIMFWVPVREVRFPWTSHCCLSAVFRREGICTGILMVYSVCVCVYVCVYLCVSVCICVWYWGAAGNVCLWCLWMRMCCMCDVCGCHCVCVFERGYGVVLCVCVCMYKWLMVCV